MDKEKVRGVDLEVNLFSDQPRIEFANAAKARSGPDKKKTVRNPNVPLTIREALNGPGTELWKQSIDKE